MWKDYNIAKRDLMAAEAEEIRELKGGADDGAEDAEKEKEEGDEGEAEGEEGKKVKKVAKSKEVLEKERVEREKRRAGVDPKPTPCAKAVPLRPPVVPPHDLYDYTEGVAGRGWGCCGEWGG